MSCNCKDCQKKRAIRDLLMVMFVDTESEEEIRKLSEFIKILSENLASKIIEAKKFDHENGSKSETVH